MSIPIDQPDWTGLNAVRGDARLVASGMASAVNFSVDVDLVPTDRSLVIAVGGGNGGVTFTVVGMTSFTAYHNAVGSQTTAGVITFPAYGAIDPVVRVGFSWTGAFEQWFILAVPDEALPVTSFTPAVTYPGAPSYPSFTTAVVALAAGAPTTTLVPAPLGAAKNQIIYLGFAPSGATAPTVGSLALIIGHTSSARFLMANNQPSAQDMSRALPCELYLAEALDCLVNLPAGLSIVFTAVYRQLSTARPVWAGF